MRFSKILYVVLLNGNAAVMAYSTFHRDGSLWPLPDVPDWLTSTQAFWVWVVGLAVAAILVVAEAVRDAARSETRRLLRTMSWFKFALIPFYGWSFIYFGTIALAFAMYGAMALFNGTSAPVPIVAVGSWVIGVLGPLAAWAVAAIGIGVTYLVFLPTSGYGIAFLVVLRRRREIGGPAFFLHVVSHLLFVADLVSTVILLVTYWKKVMSGGDAKEESRDDCPAVGAVEAPP